MTLESLKDKTELRKAVLLKRDSIPLEVRVFKDQEITERLLSYSDFVKAETIMLYASFRSEVNTFPIIEHTLKEGKTVVLPAVNALQRRLELYRINSLDDLSPGYMGIMEPKPERAVAIEESSLDFILLPGVAFDERGGRIGYGGGYYDRLVKNLTGNTRLVSLAYEEQIVEHVPLEQHDQRVHAVITDRRVIEVQDGYRKD